MTDTIQEVGRLQAKNIIMGRSPVGLFWYQDFDGRFMGIDNSKFRHDQAKDPLAEYFETKEECLKWLKGKCL